MARIFSLFVLVGCTTTVAPVKPVSAPVAAERPKVQHASAESTSESASTATLTAEIVAAGVIVGDVTTGTTSAPQTSTGWVHVMPGDRMPQFLPGGTTFAAAPGMRFGIEVVLKGPPKGTLVPVRTRVTRER